MKLVVAVPAISILLLRAISNKSLTPLGILAALATAVVHAIHPWPIFFALLTVFFLGGTAVTKVKHDVKSRLTLSSSGSSGGEGPRTHVQVLANSIVASVLVLLHYYQISTGSVPLSCWPYGTDLVVVGIVCNYASVAADTFSSELGILSTSQPRLLTSLTIRRVPPGTNGGVTLLGTFAGLIGALTIAISSVLLLPFCHSASSSAVLSTSLKAGFDGGHGWALKEKASWVAFVTLWGGLGSLMDSALGSLLQASVVDIRTGKVVEGSGGKKVLVTPSQTKKNDGGSASRRVESGWAVLDNNDVNLLMAALMSVSGMIAASWAWNIPLQSALRPWL